MYDYTACSDFRGREEEQPENSWLMTIPAKKFTEICNEFPVFRSFLILRGLQRRAFMKVKQKMIIDKLGIHNVQTRFKQIAKNNMYRLMTEKPNILKATDLE